MSLKDPIIFDLSPKDPPIYLVAPVTERPLCLRCLVALVHHSDIWVPPPPPGRKYGGRCLLSWIKTIDIEYTKRLDRRRLCFGDDLTAGSNFVVQSNKSVWCCSCSAILCPSDQLKSCVRLKKKFCVSKLPPAFVFLWAFDFAKFGLSCFFSWNYFFFNFTTKNKESMLFWKNFRHVGA